MSNWIWDRTKSFTFVFTDFEKQETFSYSTSLFETYFDRLRRIQGALFGS